jgi:hypothetical protein
MAYICTYSVPGFVQSWSTTYVVNLKPYIMALQSATIYQNNFCNRAGSFIPVCENYLPRYEYKSVNKSASYLSRYETTYIRMTKLLILVWNFLPHYTYYRENGLFLFQFAASYPYPQSWISITFPESVVIQKVKAYTEDVGPPSWKVCRDTDSG